jgi:zinc/manganese transport system substrate-binding protein
MRIGIKGAWISACLALALGACGSVAASPGASSGKLEMVAAENFWGSIARQIGGEHATVTSIITNPDTDPHSYEPTPGDARLMALSSYVIENGAGYDPWVAKLFSANPSSGRTLLDIAGLNGVAKGRNPHMWYSPAYVVKVADRIASDLGKRDAGNAGYFDQQRRQFESVGLKQYNDLRASIRSRYNRVPVAATESIFVYLAQDLQLDLITPVDFLKAISEGTDPTAQDKLTFDRQISGRQFKVLVVNSQNSTPDVDALKQKAQAQGIPIVLITETLAPVSATFQDWQVSQLEALQSALARATGQ